MPPFEFWFDFASTYSYVAAGRLGPLAERAGVDVRWRPFLLGPIFTSQLGIQDSPFNVQPVRGRYMWRDLERLCARHGIAWRKPSAFPRNGLLAARVSCLSPDAPWVPAFCRAVFRANFAEDRDISDPAVGIHLEKGLSHISGLERVADIAHRDAFVERLALRVGHQRADLLGRQESAHILVCHIGSRAQPFHLFPAQHIWQMHPYAGKFDMRHRRALQFLLAEEVLIETAERCQGPVYTICTVMRLQGAGCLGTGYL